MTVDRRLREEFLSFIQGIYPDVSIRQMRSDGYKPVVIGYVHDFDYNGSIQQAFTDARRKRKVCNVGLEVMPSRLKWIEDFVRVSGEYKRSHSSADPSYHETVRHAEEYRNTNHVTNLASWLIENGFTVHPVESEDMIKWKEEAERNIDLLKDFE